MSKILIVHVLLFLGIFCGAKLCNAKSCNSKSHSTNPCENNSDQCKIRSLLVNTKSGRIRGLTQYTFFKGVPFTSFIGIPYAEKPIGDLRFKAPEEVKPWTKTLITTNAYQPSCINFTNGMNLSDVRKSEDCLYLNIFVPRICRKEKIPVMFFIHGGGFLDGNGDKEYYGADSFMQLKCNKVILVTINYRLGPFGFLNLDEVGYTGNMGFKDQELAFNWVYKNIKYFGGDKKQITIFGQSSGAAATHYQILKQELSGKPKAKRGVMMSGSALLAYAFYENNHREFILKTFAQELGGTRNMTLVIEKVLKLNTSEFLTRLAPFLLLNYNLKYIWTATIEDQEKAVNPFLLDHPRNILKMLIASNSKLKAEYMFGFTSAEYISSVNSSDPYYFVPRLNQKFDMDVPFNFINLPENSRAYNTYEETLRTFYFKNHPIQNDTRSVISFSRMWSDTFVDYGIYEAVKFHARLGKTYYYVDDVDLNLNYQKIASHTTIKGMLHFEDMPYIFFSAKILELYEKLKENPSDPKNARTLAISKAMTSFYANFAYGSMQCFRPVKKSKVYSILISNDGIFARKPKYAPFRKAMKLWSRIHEELQPYIYYAN